jgi:hypothetical protein
MRNIEKYESVFSPALFTSDLLSALKSEAFGCDQCVEVSRALPPLN